MVGEDIVLLDGDPIPILARVELAFEGLRDSCGRDSELGRLLFVGSDEVALRDERDMYVGRNVGPSWKESQVEWSKEPLQGLDQN